MNKLRTILESLTNEQRKTFKVVIMRKSKETNEWYAYVCKEDVYIDTGADCSVNNTQLSDVLNVLSDYKIHIEIEYGYFYLI